MRLLWEKRDFFKQMGIGNFPLSLGPFDTGPAGAAEQDNSQDPNDEQANRNRLHGFDPG